MPNLPAWPAKPVDGSATALIVAVPSTTGGHGEARGWKRAVRSIASIRAGRSAVIVTDESLHTGPPPVGVRRTTSTLNGGAVDGHGLATFPVFASGAYIPHAPSTPNRGANATPYRGIDDGVTIPATYAGNPQ